MSDLSNFAPQESDTVKQIYAWHKKMGESEPSRGYLGASILGHECERNLWYNFRGCVPRSFSGRMFRLFETGNLEEPRMVKELCAIGCEVHEVDPNTGEQFAVSALGGHFSGHMDGCAIGIPEAPLTWHVLEFKTHSEKSFAKLVTAGVAASKPQHYAQVMVYMGLTGLTRALYLGKNKNTDQLYAERIPYDSTAFKCLMNRAERIIKSTAPPERIAKRQDSFHCRFCAAKELCWGTSDIAVPIPTKACRTCCHATPDTEREDAVWVCKKHNFDVSPVGSAIGCENHLLLPDLVSFAEPTDAGDDWIEFTNHEDAAVWRHGPGKGMFSTKELITTAGPLGPPGAARVQAKGVQSVEPEPEPTGFELPKDLSLLAQYPWQDSERVWDGPSSALGEEITRLIGFSVAITPTAQEKTAEWEAFEYGNHELLAVVYHTGDQHHAAIWRGKS